MKVLSQGPWKFLNYWKSKSFARYPYEIKKSCHLPPPPTPFTVENFTLKIYVTPQRNNENNFHSQHTCGYKLRIRLQLKHIPSHTKPFWYLFYLLNSYLFNKKKITNKLNSYFTIHTSILITDNLLLRVLYYSVKDLLNGMDIFARLFSSLYGWCLLVGNIIEFVTN